MTHKTWILFNATLLALAGLVFAACGAEEEAAADDDDVTAEAEPVTEDDAPDEMEEPAEPEACEVDGEAAAVAEDPSFELRASASGPYTAGEQGTFGIRLTPRGEYHVNEQFPLRVRPCAAEAVTLPSPELDNEDAAEHTEQTARFEVPFTATEAGEHRVSAIVDFAVCTPETCIPETRTVAVLLPVE